MNEVSLANFTRVTEKNEVITLTLIRVVRARGPPSNLLLIITCNDLKHQLNHHTFILNHLRRC